MSDKPAVSLDTSELTPFKVRGICCEACLTYTVRGTVWKVHNPRNSQQPLYYCTICHDRIIHALPMHVDESGET